MTKMLTGISGMIGAIRVWIPLISAVTIMRMVSLVKAGFVVGICKALYAYEKHAGYQELNNPVSHSYSIHRFRHREQYQFTESMAVPILM